MANSNPEPTFIPRELADELKDMIWGLMSHYDSYIGEAICEFCYNRANENGATEHDDDCLGIRALKALRRE